MEPFPGRVSNPRLDVSIEVPSLPYWPSRGVGTRPVAGLPRFAPEGNERSLYFRC